MASKGGAALVTGQLVIAAATPPFHGATAHVRLEDTSFADAAATILAETTIPAVSHDPGPTSDRDTVIPFALKVPSSPPSISPRNDYTVRAWVDVNSDGTAGSDDLFSDQSHPVLTHGRGNTVTITLKAH